MQRDYEEVIWKARRNEKGLEWKGTKRQNSRDETPARSSLYVQIHMS